MKFKNMSPHTMQYETTAATVIYGTVRKMSIIQGSKQSKNIEKSDEYKYEERKKGKK